MQLLFLGRECGPFNHRKLDNPKVARAELGHEVTANLEQLTNVGGQFDQALIALIPVQYLDAFFNAIKAGIADAIGSIFWLSVVASLVAFVAETLIEEIPLRGGAKGAPAEM